MECVYGVYAEAWVEDSTRHTYLIQSTAACSGVSPFELLCSEEGAAVLHKEEGPNRRVIKCKKDVSLRESPSTKSQRLARVPLGVVVFAFPEEDEVDGFVRCVYGDEYGYILSEYLQPVE